MRLAVVVLCAWALWSLAAAAQDKPAGWDELIVAARREGAEAVLEKRHMVPFVDGEKVPDGHDAPVWCELSFVPARGDTRADPSEWRCRVSTVIAILVRP